MAVRGGSRYYHIWRLEACATWGSLSRLRVCKLPAPRRWLGLPANRWECRDATQSTPLNRTPNIIYGDSTAGSSNCCFD